MTGIHQPYPEKDNKHDKLKKPVLFFYTRVGGQKRQLKVNFFRSNLKEATYGLFCSMVLVLSNENPENNSIL